MSAPFIFITTHVLNEGKLEDYLDQNRDFRDFVEANGPRLLDFQVYMSEDQSEVTFVFVYPDAAAADHHMQIARERIGRGLEITRTARLEVFGTPGPVLGQVLRANADHGVPLTVKPTALGGFRRAAAV